MLVGDIDARAVLGAHVATLAHALRRVVVLPEDLEQLLVGDHRGVEDHEDGLGVPSPTGADLLIARVGREPADVADRGRVHAG